MLGPRFEAVRPVRSFIFQSCFHGKSWTKIESESRWGCPRLNRVGKPKGQTLFLAWNHIPPRRIHDFQEDAVASDSLLKVDGGGRAKSWVLCSYQNELKLVDFGCVFTYIWKQFPFPFPFKRPRKKAAVIVTFLPGRRRRRKSLKDFGLGSPSCNLAPVQKIPGLLAAVLPHSLNRSWGNCSPLLVPERRGCFVGTPTFKRWHSHYYWKIEFCRYPWRKVWALPEKKKFKKFPYFFDYKEKRRWWEYSGSQTLIPLYVSLESPRIVAACSWLVLWGNWVSFPKEHLSAK